MRSEAQRACSRELIFTVIYGFSNSAISRKLLIFSIWLRERKYFIFDHIIDIRDEPAQPIHVRPDPTITLFDGLFLRGYFFSNPAGPVGSWRISMYGQIETFVFHKPYEKIKTFRDIALFENPYMTVEIRSRLQARSASLHVARNNLREEQNLF